MSFKNEEFLELVYLASDGDASNSGKSAADPKPLVDTDGLIDLPAGAVVEHVDVVITAALVGVTEMELGDGSDDNGFAASGDITYGSEGAYRGAGAYISGANKYYAAADAVDMDVVGTASAGSCIVRVKGYRL
jgi:hypothetical protein